MFGTNFYFAVMYFSRHSKKQKLYIGIRAAQQRQRPVSGKATLKVKSARDWQNVDFWRFRDFLAGASHLGTAIPGDSPESWLFKKSKKLFGPSVPLEVHMSQIGIRLFPKSRATSEWPFVLQTIQVGICFFSWLFKTRLFSRLLSGKRRP